MSPKTRATLATLLFTLAGTSSFFGKQVWETPLGILLAVIFALLVMHTFFSVRFFSALVKSDSIQQVIDAILVALYLFLAFSMDDATTFFFVGFGLFSIATLKYIFLLKHVLYQKPLWRKIWIDLVGAVAWGMAFAGALLGFAGESAWALAIAFFLANAYLLLINPMYRL